MDLKKVITLGKKLKALADRGLFAGEKESAKTKLENHLKKHNLTMADIDGSANIRIFKLYSKEQEVLLSFIILSVYPLANINKGKKEYKVALDDEDFIEVNAKMEHFYNVYKKEKEILLTAFLNKHHEKLQPDDYSMQKCRAEMGNVEDKYDEIVKENKEKSDSPEEKEKKRKKNEADAKSGKFKDDIDPLFNKKVEFVKKMLRDIKYVRARRSLNK